jgi:hypothetical protein
VKAGSRIGFSIFGAVAVVDPGVEQRVLKLAHTAKIHICASARTHGCNANACTHGHQNKSHFSFSGQTHVNARLINTHQAPGAQNSNQHTPQNFSLKRAWISLEARAPTKIIFPPPPHPPRIISTTVRGYQLSEAACIQQ